MEAIFDLPVATIELQQPLGSALVGRQAGDAVDDLLGFLLALEVDDFPSDGEDLTQEGEIEVVIEFDAGPDLAQLQPAVPFIDCGVLRGENP